MPEESIMETDLSSALDSLEHYGLENHLSRTQDYNIIQNALSKNENLSLEDTERLLAICVHDLREDMKYVATIMNIILFILSRVEMGKYDQYPELLPSALAVIHIIKTTALLSKVESLKILCYDTLLAYPDDTLIATTDHHEEIMEIFNLYCHMRIPTKIRQQACSLLHRIMKILPPEKKKVFVEKGLPVWFSKIIPTIMSHVAVSTEYCEISMETLELLTDELVTINYNDNLQWHNVLECICTPQKYPAVMKNLLQKESDIWHRLWIVFIRLLKNQVTQSMGNIGTPINSMLPVVEAAFKVDVKNRCRAFECWNVLIDSFSTETNESNINKRLKLLIIPLKSNNAKVEATALAKFRCWWHLIQKFQYKIDKFLDNILVSFLNFCFGRHNALDKSVLVPGQISIAVKKLCIQGIVDIVGHVNCDGCTDLPKLKGRLINTKNLVDNWNHWIFSLTSTIMMSANTDDGLTKQQMTCLWTSFIRTIGELPENNIRKDLFSEMLAIVVHLLQKCEMNSKLCDIVFDALVLSLFEGDISIKHLLKTKTDIENEPLYKIIALIILNPSLNVAYQSCDSRELVSKLKPVANMVLDPVFSSPTPLVNCLLKKFPINDFALAAWTALLESICESEHEVCLQNLCNLLLWPLTIIKSFTDIKISAMAWYKSYDLFYQKINKNDKIKTKILDTAVSKFLFVSKDMSYSIIYFKLCVTLAVIKHKMTEKNCVACEKELDLLDNLISRMENYKSLHFFEQLFPILVDRLIGIISILVSNVNESLARYTLFCVTGLLTWMTQACDQLTDASQIFSLVGLLKSLDSLIQVGSYYRFIPVTVDKFIDCASVLSKQPATKNAVLSVLKTFASKIVEKDSAFKKMKALIYNIENETKSLENNQGSDKNAFTAPTKEIPKKGKKKEASIVNTVVDNGEEYVVVKSNWKFNPRKLTENQKEKLQRKREDIPALYQDLSQSQDEYKLAAWKTDSQDTSNSSKSESKSSKSHGTETTSEMLANLPSSNVVPKILENFFSEKKKTDTPVKETNAKDSLPVDNKVNKMETSTPKNTKSPRMALKDRVFRNVRNLIEKSGVQKENKETSEDLNKTENLIKTPTQSKSKDVTNIVNSAPPLLSADRPTRVKRKPKKFDESQLLLLAKKRRQSLLDSKSDNTPETSDPSKISSKIDTDTNVNSVEDFSPPVVSISDDEDVNKSGDVKVSENLNISDTNQVIQSNECLKEDVSKINKTIDTSNEAQVIDKVDKEKHTTSMDLDISSDTYKDSEKSNEKIETSKKNDTNKNNEIIIIHDEKCNIIKNGKTEAVKERTITKKEGEKANDVQDQKSHDNKGENPTDNKVEKSKNKIDVKSKDKIDEKSEDKVDEKSKDKKSKRKIDTESNDQKDVNSSVNPGTKDAKEISTPQQSSKNRGTEEQKSTNKKVKKSRIEIELAIDTVEGHPLLNIQTQKRLTRKALESAGTGRRKSLAEKINKAKSEANCVKSNKKTSEKKSESDCSNSSFTVDDSQEKVAEIKDQTSFTEDLPYSDDVIESSQDSTMTTISVKSTKNSSKKVPVVSLQKIKLLEDKAENISESQSILDCVRVPTESSSKTNQESKDDIELPLNKTAFEEKSQADLTENMDTEPIDEKEFSVIVINNDIPAPLTISSEDTEVGIETQEIAEADTQPTDPNDFMDVDEAFETANKSSTVADDIKENCFNKDKAQSPTKDKTISETSVNPSDNTITLSESACVKLEKESGASSPSSFGEEAKRKQDFLNNTLEISPIKNMSPERRKKSPSPETSSDYVVIKLSSPVHSNGEPFEKCGSPEVFTEEKVLSPDKRDQSPPRVEVSVTNNTSPSSSLSLKKSRPQVRSGGRAAQMLGLCVPDKLQTIMNTEKSETEEIKKTGTSSTPARRNLRILYNSVNDITEPTSEVSEESENFLKFRRSLPMVDSSPSGPILKRKLVEIADEATISPASKRKRVSFHDPPVSTTISVHKYIEPGGVRSPQNSANKRLERQLRQQMPVKSPKRLDHAFKLDTVLTRAIESFSETEVLTTPDDTQPLDETPVVEIVRASELNDTDPICPELVDCKDLIDNIAGELSSFAMKSLLVKELVGKVETVGDLAKMTELEVNRLCIKAPKVKVAKKVLSDYVSKRIEKQPSDVMVTINEAVFEEPLPEPEMRGIDMEVQTDKNASCEIEVQTVATPTNVTFVQTETTLTTDTDVQTDESGSKSTADIIKSCLAERPDFVEEVSVQLEDSSIQQISDKLPFSAITDVLMKKVTPADAKSLLNRVLEDQWNSSSEENRRSKELSFIREYMCDRFDSKDLILFCSDLLKAVYDKPA